MGKLADAFVDISANKSKLSTGLSAARQEINSFATASASRMASLGKNLLAFGGIGAAAFGVGEILKNTAEGEKAVARLGVALKSVGEGANAEEFNQYADTLKAVYGVDDDLIRQTMTLAINLGATGENIKDLTQLAIGLADVLGTDMKDALQTIQKAQEGNFKAFEKMFPAMKDLATSEEKLAFVTRIAQQGLAQKRAEMERLGGSTEQLQLALGDLSKSIGALVSSPLASFFTDTASAVKTFTAGTEESQRSLLTMAEAGLKMKKFWADFTGDANNAAKIQEQINHLEQMVNDSITRQTNAANEAGNKEVNIKLKALRRIEDETKKTFGTLEGLYESAQEAMFGGGRIVGAGAGGGGVNAPLNAPAPGGFVPPGGLKFRGGKAGPRMLNPGEGTDMRESLQDRATRLREMAKQVDAAKAQELNDKADQIDRRALQYPRGEAQPSVMQRMGMMLSELMTGHMPLRVKEEHADDLVATLKALNAAIPRIVGRFGN